MSRQSIRNVLRASANAGQGHAPSAACVTAAAHRTTLASLATAAAAFSTSSGAAARIRSTPVPCTALAPRPARRLRLLPAPSLQGGQPRLLSTTAPRCAQAIAFSPTSSPELDATLENIRTSIFLPSYLSADQRRRLFSPRHEQTLRANPITLDLDGEVLRFGHMDRFRDVPNARAAARDAVGRMTTRADFENLPRLLEGLHRAGRHLRPADYARIARRAGERGCIFAVIESARTVRRTGFRLDSSETVAEILTHVQLKAVDSAWAEAPTRQALAWAELVVDLLQDEQHGRRLPAAAAAAAAASSAAAAAEPSSSSAAIAATPPPPPPAFPLARDPQVLAARLHLAAVVADRFDNSSSSGETSEATTSSSSDAAVGKVSRHATELVQLWPAGGRGLRALHPAATYADRRGEMRYLGEDNKFLGVAAPLLHGLDAAMRVLGGRQGGSAALVGELQARRDALAAEVQAALAAAPDRRGAAIYHKFYQ